MSLSMTLYLPVAADPARSKRIEGTIKEMQEKSEGKKMEVCIAFQMSVVFLLTLLQDSSNPISDAAATGRLCISLYDPSNQRNQKASESSLSSAPQKRRKYAQGHS